LPQRDLPLGIVLDACPGLKDLAVGREIRHWRDFLAAADIARPMLGISPSAWRDAAEAMGERQAAITLAAIYQKGAQINDAGGYLRRLTDRVRDGKFTTWPMIMALLRADLDSKASSGVSEIGGDRRDLARQHLDAEERRQSTVPVSDALRQSLEKPK